MHCKGSNKCTAASALAQLPSGTAAEEQQANLAWTQAAPTHEVAGNRSAIVCDGCIQCSLVTCFVSCDAGLPEE